MRAFSRDISRAEGEGVERQDDRRMVRYVFIFRQDIEAHTSSAVRGEDIVNAAIRMDPIGSACWS